MATSLSYILWFVDTPLHDLVYSNGTRISQADRQMPLAAQMVAELFG